MGLCGLCAEDQHTDRNEDSTDIAHVASERNRLSRNLARGHTCNGLTESGYVLPMSLKYEQG